MLSAGHAPTPGRTYKSIVLCNSKLHHAHQFRDGRKWALKSVVTRLGIIILGKNETQKESKDLRVDLPKACGLGLTGVFRWNLAHELLLCLVTQN